MNYFKPFNYLEYTFINTLIIENIDTLEKPKRARLGKPDATPVTQDITRKSGDLSLKSKQSITYNFNIYFREQHVGQRMEERNITQEEILSLVNAALKSIVYFSFETKFNLIRHNQKPGENTMDPKNNAFMIQSVSNEGDELSIPVSIVANSSNKENFDVIIHTAFKFEDQRLWQGQYVIRIHPDEEPQLLQKISGKLIEIR